MRKSIREDATVSVRTPTSAQTGLEPFVTSEQVAEFLGKPVSWIHNNAGRLGIPRARLGNHWRYRLSDVSDWLERQGRQ
jgi:hypothetical protein